MRIAYLSLEAPREGQASFAHVHEIVAGLRERGHDVELFVPSYSGKWARPPLIMRIVEHLFLQLRLALRFGQFRVIYIRAHPMAFPIVFFARLLKQPVVQEINGPYEHLFVAYPAAAHFRRVVEWSQRAQYRWANGLIAVTPQLGQWLEREAPSRPVIIISNGANIKLFNPQRERDCNLPQSYVVFFCSLECWHGLDTVISAVGHVKWPVNVHLVVVGDGQGRAILEQAARCNPRLMILGQQPYAKVGAIVAGAIAGLVPISNPGGRSNRGLAPLKLFETLACGIPAIVSDFPYQADLVRMNGCGLVFPADDAAALAQAVSEIALNPSIAEKMGKCGLELVEKEHSWDLHAAETEAFLRQLLA